MSIHLLLVEDDEVDAEAVLRAMSKTGFDAPHSHVVDGEEALGWLNAYEGEDPVVMLLDVNLPRLRGLDLLDRIRSHERWRNMVVFMLTSSDDPTDVERAYGNHVAGYVKKDDQGDGYARLLNIIQAYDDTGQVPART